MIVKSEQKTRKLGGNSSNAKFLKPSFWEKGDTLLLEFNTKSKSKYGNTYYCTLKDFKELKGQGLKELNLQKGDVVGLNDTNFTLKQILEDIQYKGTLFQVTFKGMYPTKLGKQGYNFEGVEFVDSDTTSKEDVTDVPDSLL